MLTETPLALEDNVLLDIRNVDVGFHVEILVSLSSDV